LSSAHNPRKGNVQILRARVVVSFAPCSRLARGHKSRYTANQLVLLRFRQEVGH
jgi:hypothetical protein